MSKVITLEVMSAHTACELKAHLLLGGQQGQKCDYEAALAERRAEVRFNAIRKVLDQRPGQTLLSGVALTRPALAKGAPFILGTDFAEEGLAVHFDGVKRVEGPSHLGDFHYVPVLFHEGIKVRKPQRLLLEALALLLARVQGTVPRTGIVFHGPECAATTVRLTPGLGDAGELLAKLEQLRGGETPPKLLLNDHCSVCEFRRRCHDRAVAEDNLSLLRGLGEKELRGLARKGLFTLTQLAHTFRPRRKGKRADHRSHHRYHALQALAIRDRRVYVLGTPAVPTAACRIYLDTEGDPERGFIYLLGLIVCDEQGEARYSFWADDKDREAAIFQEFLAVVGRYESPLIFCYGSYEKAFMKRMLRQAKRKGPVKQVLDSLVNTLSIMFAHFYFPTYSNGLKAVAGCLGHSWSDPEASGAQSIAWRMRWERTRDDEWKRKLLEYNQEDCTALRKVTDFLLDAATGAMAQSATTPPALKPSGAAEGSVPAVMRVHELDKLANTRKWGRVNFVHPGFEFVNNCAYFDYQRQRVFVRTSRTIRKHRRKAGGRPNCKLRPSRRLVITASKCPKCGGADLAELATGERPEVQRPRLKRAMDLVITAAGMRRRVIECRSLAYRCTACSHAFVPERHRRLAKHYHGLMSWAMYEHVAHQVSNNTLEEKFREYFNLGVANPEVHMFKGLMARYYRATARGLLAKILAGPVLHVDETEVKLRTGKGYVWVFASLEEVVFLYKPTREGDFLREMLKDFRGVLVSDFYAAYDSIDCPQQKCLIHLIRDMNQELLSNPFDEELRRVTLPFSTLLQSVVRSVDAHGLRRYYLSRHKGEVDAFFRTLEAQPFQSDAAVALRARLQKNRDKLFTFIQHDGVPWNNNNAENGVKRFAYYREGTVGTLKEAGLSDYLVLLSLYQTCRYKGVSFLKFLLSKERGVDAYCLRKRPPRHPDVELYPKGFVPPHFPSMRAALAQKQARAGAAPGATDVPSGDSSSLPSDARERAAGRTEPESPTETGGSRGGGPKGTTANNR